MMVILILKKEFKNFQKNSQRQMIPRLPKTLFYLTQMPDAFLAYRIYITYKNFETFGRKEVFKTFIFFLS